MSKLQSTPKPWKHYWRVDEEGHADCGVFSEARKGQAVSVCRAPRYQTKEQWEVDAPLISAAPDLLEALAAILNAEDSAVAHIPHALVDNASAALKKAKP